MLVACGSDTPTPGSVETPPSSSPSPTATNGGYLHVLQSPFLVTYEIDGASGRLHPPVTQKFSDARLLASDPRGRFVYAAHSTERSGSGGSDLTIASYAPDPDDGTLGFVSQALVSESGYPPSWSWIAAGEDRVYGSWSYRWGTAGRHTSAVYVSAAVAEDGRLGPMTSRAFAYDADSGVAIVDVRAAMAYKAGTYPATPDTVDAKGGVTAHSIQPDGQLTGTGWSNLCLGTVVPLYTPIQPLVAARDFLFARTHLEPGRWELGRWFTCSYRGRRLAPHDKLELDANLASAFEPSSLTEPVLIAMDVNVSAGNTVRHELQLHSMDAEGHLHLLSSDELPNGSTQILFHPSGRFLFVSDRDWRYPLNRRLRGYAIEADGELQRVVDIDNAGGSLAISLPGAAAASSSAR